MNKEKLFKEVMTKTFSQTVDDFSYNVDIQNGDDKVSVSFEDYFEDTMATIRLMNDNSTDKSTDCAMAFALHSINIAAQTRQIQDRIDAFFTSADNQSWLKENGVADDEKTAVCQEIKDFISDKMKIEGSTKEEKDFVEKINAVFDGKEEKPAAHLENALNFFSAVNKSRQNGRSAADALNSAYNDRAFSDGSNKITDAIVNNISALSGSIAKESADKYMKDVCANYIDDEEVTAESFTQHYNLAPNALSHKEKEWAHKMYCRMLFNTVDMDNGYDITNIDVTSFLANGEQIISNEELESAKDKNGVFDSEKLRAMEDKVVARMAAGEQISVRKYAPEKSVDIKPDDIQLKDSDGMSFRIFSSHYETNNPLRLTSYDKQWANEAFDKMYYSVVNVDSGWTKQDVNMSSFYANGKQIITNEEYEKAKNEKGELAPEKESEMKLKIAAKLAAGDKITVRRNVPEKPLALDEKKSKENNRPELTANVEQKEVSDARVEKKTGTKSAVTQNARFNRVNNRPQRKVQPISQPKSQPNGQTNEQSDGQTNDDSKDQSKEEKRGFPMSFEELLVRLFEILFDAINELTHQHEGKARIKVTYDEIMGEKHLEKKNLPNQKTNEKTKNQTLEKRGKSM